MSPVSRGRKSKKSKKSSGPGGAARRRTESAPAGAAQQSAFTGIQSLLGPPQRPAWFDSSLKTVLDRADVVLAARGPRELEEATAQLLGAELHRILHEEHQGLWFSRWFTDLTEAAAARIGEEADRGAGGWEPLWRLLHGLTSIGSPALQSLAQAELDGAKEKLRGEGVLRQQPGWLPQLARITATGEVWEMRDAYGTRIALIAGFSYPERVDPSVFLFDIDACGFVEIVHAGVFDDVAQAAAAWRAYVGEAAQDAQPERVESAQRLLSLAHCSRCTTTSTRIRWRRHSPNGMRGATVANRIRRVPVRWPRNGWKGRCPTPGIRPRRIESKSSSR